ncbi:hypothetical protein [Halosimplex carlsbadense]|uniref:hypothetical protein n=1 Tax=Halosimplex carlsbadense TaxID=171164 RepID=UPI0012693992|nr:hypothetical protein [Halosimplex carlsbadense]
MTQVPQPPESRSRQELEEEVSRLRELEERVDDLEKLVGTLGDTPPEEAGLKKVTLGGAPVGKLANRNKDRFKDLKEEIEELSTKPKVTGNQEEMLPGHRMYTHLITDNNHSLSETQKRAARIFGLFLERVVNGESNKIDAAGQSYTLTSGPVEEVLLGNHDSDSSNLLVDVKEASRSQVVARTMREVARLSKLEECECENIGKCTHVNIEFRSGRPNALAASKQSFRERIKQVYDANSGAEDGRDSADTNPSNTSQGDQSHNEGNPE